MSKLLKLKKHSPAQSLQDLKKSGVIIHALIYCRVSSEKQKSEGHGLESQEQRCRDYAERNNFVVEEVFADTASGGGEYTSRRGQVELLEYVDKYPSKTFVVIIDDISRFARDVQGHFRFRLLLKERGVELASPNFNFEDSPEGEMVEGIMATVSQYHRKGNARQVIQKQVARLMLGYWPFASVRPFKMTRDTDFGNILVAQYPDTQYAKEALEKFANGELLTKADACRFLSEKGYWNGKRPEKHIDAFTAMAKNILNVGYVGYSKWGIAPIEGKHKGFISMETYTKIQKRLKREGLSSRIRIDIHPEFFARGLVLCDGCSYPLKGAYSRGRSKRYPYYVCQTRECKYYAKSIRKQVIEDRFKQLLSKSSLKEEVGKLVDVIFDRVWKEEVINVKTQEAIITTHKSSLEERARQLTEAVFGAKSPALKKIYEGQLEKLAKEMENPELESVGEIDFSVPYRTAIAKANGLLKSPLEYWEKLDVREQHRLFYFIFEEKLPYDLKIGYRTDKIQTATRLFESFVAISSTDVDHTGIEPVTSSMPWMRSTK